jgi:hypothetical protein
MLEQPPQQRRVNVSEEFDKATVSGKRVATPNDRKLSDGGGLAQPVRAKAARVG